MPVLGLVTRDATCAICKQQIAKGSEVYFDATKRYGNHLAHRNCYVELRASRGIQPSKKKKPQILSHEELDPPF